MKEPESYYLLEHRPKNLEPVWNPTRRLPDATGSTSIATIVHHTAENVPDFRPPDHGGENVARYGANIKRKASWGATVDSDSLIWMLPDSYRSWHCHLISNSSLGVEIAYKASLWGTGEGWYESSHLENCARLVGYWCVKHDIPAVWLDFDEVMAGKRGLTNHGWIDPNRRTDPGVSAKKRKGSGKRDYRFTTFPHDEYMERLQKQIVAQKRRGLFVPVAWVPGQGPKAARGGVKVEAPSHGPEGKPDWRAAAWEQSKQNVARTSQVSVDSTVEPVSDAEVDAVLAAVLGSTVYSAWPKAVIRRVQALVGVTVDGVVGPDTRHAVAVWANKHGHGSGS